MRSEVSFWEWRELQSFRDFVCVVWTDSKELLLCIIHWKTRWFLFLHKNKLPFGLLIDKISAKYQNWHITYNSSANLGHKIILDKQSCYIRFSLVCIASSEVIIKHILYNLKAFHFHYVILRSILSRRPWMDNIHLRMSIKYGWETTTKY